MNWAVANASRILPVHCVRLAAAGRPFSSSNLLPPVGRLPQRLGMSTARIAFEDPFVFASAPTAAAVPAVKPPAMDGVKNPTASSPAIARQALAGDMRKFDDLDKLLGDAHSAVANSFVAVGSSAQQGDRLKTSVRECLEAVEDAVASLKAAFPTAFKAGDLDVSQLGKFSSIQRSAMLEHIVNLRRLALRPVGCPHQLIRGTIRQRLRLLYTTAIGIEIQLVHAHALIPDQEAALCRMERAFRDDVLASCSPPSVAPHPPPLFLPPPHALDLVLDALQRHASTTSLVALLARDFFRTPERAFGYAPDGKTVALVMRARLRDRAFDATAFESLLSVHAPADMLVGVVRAKLIVPWMVVMRRQVLAAQAAGASAESCRDFRRECVRRLLVALSALRKHTTWPRGAAAAAADGSKPSAAVSAETALKYYDASVEPIATELSAQGDRCIMLELLEPWMEQHGIPKADRHGFLLAQCADAGKN
jgi:hypothetical protein